MDAVSHVSCRTQWLSIASIESKCICLLTAENAGTEARIT